MLFVSVNILCFFVAVTFMLWYLFMSIFYDHCSSHCFTISTTFVSVYVQQHLFQLMFYCLPKCSCQLTFYAIFLLCSVMNVPVNCLLPLSQCCTVFVPVKVLRSLSWPVFYGKLFRFNDGCFWQNATRKTFCANTFIVTPLSLNVRNGILLPKKMHNNSLLTSTVCICI